MSKEQNDLKIRFIKVTRDGSPLMINIDHIIFIQKVNNKARIFVSNGGDIAVDQSYEDMTYLIPDNYSLQELEK